MNRIWNHFKRRVLQDNKGQFDPATLAALLSAASSGYSLFQNITGGGDDEDIGRELNLPDFAVNPLVGATQNRLFDIGSNLLEGDFPDFLKPSTEIGGKEFEDFNALINRDVTKLVEESAARRGSARGSSLTAPLAKTLLENTTKLRFADRNRALTARESLFGRGLATVSDVGNRALSEQGQTNQFALGRSQIESNFITEMNRIAAEAAAAEGQGFAGIIGAIPDLLSGFGGKKKTTEPKITSNVGAIPPALSPEDFKLAL